MANTNKITPTIYDDSNKCEIRVYYNMDYKQQQKSLNRNSAEEITQ